MSVCVLLCTIILYQMRLPGWHLIVWHMLVYMCMYLHMSVPHVQVLESISYG